MSSWSCPHEVHGLCQRVNGAYCRPGMRGCVLCGKVQFEDGVIPAPRWPPEATEGTAAGAEGIAPAAGILSPAAGAEGIAPAAGLLKPASG